jgi:hypothetical protein
MLRVVRFAAKLQFTIEPATRAPIPVMAPLINNVPAARVFDEMLKLLMSGHALACLKELRSAGLHHGLLPLLDVVLEQPIGMKFVTLALESTDARVRAGKGVSPGFLFASLLWHQVLEKWNAYRAAGEAPIPALHLAADDVLDNQTDKLALQRRIATDMRDIWAMQPRFERRNGKAPYKLLEHPRFRAGFDFLLLRCESGELDADSATGGPASTAATSPSANAWSIRPTRAGAGRRQEKRPRRRAPRKAGEGETVASTAAGGAGRRMIAWIGIGANLGDAKGNVLDALERLAKAAGRAPAASLVAVPHGADRFLGRRLHQRRGRRRHRPDAHALLPALQASNRPTAANGPTATPRARSTSTCCCMATRSSPMRRLDRAASAHARTRLRAGAAGRTRPSCAFPAAAAASLLAGVADQAIERIS